MSAFFPLHFTAFFISIHLTSSLFNHFFSFLKLGSSPYILVQKPKYFFLTIWNLSSNWAQVLLGSAQFFLVIGKMTLFYYLALPILLPLTLCFIKMDQKFGRGSASSRLVFCWFLTESSFFYMHLFNQHCVFVHENLEVVLLRWCDHLFTAKHEILFLFVLQNNAPTMCQSSALFLSSWLC